MKTNQPNKRGSQNGQDMASAMELAMGARSKGLSSAVDKGVGVVVIIHAEGSLEPSPDEEALKFLPMNAGGGDVVIRFPNANAFKFFSPGMVRYLLDGKFGDNRSLDVGGNGEEAEVMIGVAVAPIDTDEKFGMLCEGYPYIDLKELFPYVRRVFPNY